MNAPQALYWYHQQPRQAEHRNSSANRTGPYITELDMTGQPGVLKVVKYVPEAAVAEAVMVANQNAESLHAALNQRDLLLDALEGLLATVKGQKAGSFAEAEKLANFAISAAKGGQR